MHLAIKQTSTCRSDNQVIEIFNYLREALPWFKNASDAPFVQVSSSLAPITEAKIQERKDIGLYISTTKMLMGVNVPGISLVIFLRPLNMLHYIAQGAGRGGRRIGDNSGLRNKVVAYLLWNNSDISANVKGRHTSSMCSIRKKITRRTTGSKS